MKGTLNDVPLASRQGTLKEGPEPSHQSTGKSIKILEKVYAEEMKRSKCDKNTDNTLKHSMMEGEKDSGPTSESESTSTVSTILLSPSSSSNDSNSAGSDCIVTFCSIINSPTKKENKNCSKNLVGGTDILKTTFNADLSQQSQPADELDKSRLRKKTNVNYSEKIYFNSTGVNLNLLRTDVNRRKSNVFQNSPDNDNDNSVGSDMRSNISAATTIRVITTDDNETPSNILHSLKPKPNVGGGKNLSKLGILHYTGKYRDLHKASHQLGATEFSRQEGWDEFLLKERNRKLVAPVNLFQHVPFADVWDKFATVGLIIEAPNPYASENCQLFYWIARVCEFAGYRARIEYERFDMLPRQYCWIPFCSLVPQPLGYADMNNKILHPAWDVAEVHEDFIDKARKKLMGMDTLLTLQDDQREIARRRIHSRQLYEMGTQLEVIDLNAFHRNQIARVTAIIGDRIHVTYGLPKRSSKFDYGHFLNVRSEHIYPLGWSDYVGHYIYVTDKDRAKLSEKHQLIKWKDFPSYPEDKMTIDLGMALEIRDAKTPHRIVPAFICKILKHGYFIVEFEAFNPKSCYNIAYHVTSPYVLPCGFAKSHGLEMYHPKDESITNWESLGCVPLDLSALPEKPPHSFEVGMKLEAVDLCEPNLLRPATVVQIAGHLLKLHFDTLPKENDKSYQWLDAKSYDIYPVGWAEMVGHRLEGQPEDLQTVPEKQASTIQTLNNVGDASLIVDIKDPSIP